MNSESKKKLAMNITIIGGGFSGILVATHLSKCGPKTLRITLINKNYPIARGIAYNPYSDSHLLNVVASRMSAFEDKPNHFVDWVVNMRLLGSLDRNFVAAAYLSRKHYGSYLESIWKNTLKVAGSKITVINDWAVDVISNGNYSVLLESGKRIDSDFLVLATGNELPRNPGMPNSNFFRSNKYFRNPWKSDCISKTDALSQVLIIGNGLTMVDTSIALKSNGFQGTIFSISPHGFLVLPHRGNGIQYEALMKEFQKPLSLWRLVKLFNKHIKLLRQIGLSAEPVIDSIRSHTQSIWLSLSESDRRIFIQRLRHLWGVARHRVPLHVYDQIIRMRLDQNLKIISGRILSLEEYGGNVKVIYFDKRAHSKKELIVQRVINCTGPESDISLSENPVLRSVYDRKITLRNSLGLGVKASSSGQIYQETGDVSQTLFAIGNLMKGVLWETTAVPELRICAKQIADQIIDNARRSTIGKSNFQEIDNRA